MSRQAEFAVADFNYYLWYCDDCMMRLGNAEAIVTMGTVPTFPDQTCLFEGTNSYTQIKKVSE